MNKQKRTRSLKAFRKAKGLKQAEAARRFGMSQASWSRWERGQHRPSRAMAKRLMDATGVPLDVLMGMAS